MYIMWIYIIGTCAGKPPPTASSAATTSTVQSNGKGKAAKGKAVLKKAAAAIKATSVLTSGKGKKTKGGGESGAGFTLRKESAK